MSKIENFRRARAMCQENAARAASKELREVWQTIESSYALLIDLELRPRISLPGFGPKARDIRQVSTDLDPDSQGERVSP